MTGAWTYGPAAWRMATEESQERFGEWLATFGAAPTDTVWVQDLGDGTALVKRWLNNSRGVRYVNEAGDIAHTVERVRSAPPHLVHRLGERCGYEGEPRAHEGNPPL